MMSTYQKANKLLAVALIGLCLSANCHIRQKISKKIFHLSDERFERPIALASGEIWGISMAIQFALNKAIFCFPWLSAYQISRFKVAHELGIIDFLKSKQKIVLVPTSQEKIVKKLCDHYLVFPVGKPQYHQCAKVKRMNRKKLAIIIFFHSFHSDQKE